MKTREHPCDPDLLRLLAEDRLPPAELDRTGAAPGVVPRLPGGTRRHGRQRPLPDGRPPVPPSRPDRSPMTSASEGRRIARLPGPVRLARLAGQAGDLRGQGRARPRRDGRGAEGVRPGPEPERRDQGPVSVAGHLRGIAPAVPPRGEGRGRGRPRARRRASSPSSSRRGCRSW